MMKQRIQKVWKDPVWSKVISVAIVALLTLFYNWIVARKGSISFYTAFISFWTLKIELWLVVVMAAFIMVLLILSRDRFRYDAEMLALDRMLFDTTREEYDMEELVLDIKFNSFSGGPVQTQRFDTLTSMLARSERTDYTFLNPKLEKLKWEVIKQLHDFNDTLHKYFFGTSHPDWLSIPSEWEFNQPDRMQEAKETIEKEENSFTLVYQKFITEGRKILKV